MGDDLDIDALLEEPFNKDSKKNGSSRSRTPDHKSGDKHSRTSDRRKRSHSRSKDRRRKSRSRERNGGERHGSERKGSERQGSERQGSERRDQNRTHDRKRSRSRERRRSPDRRRVSRSPDRRRVSRSPRRRSPVREKSPPAVTSTPEERDARTIFVMQLSQKCRAKDVEEFFSSVGQIRDVRLIICNKTRRFKGIAYVEFKEIESVSLALGLNGQKLLGIPVIVQPSQAEKNRTFQAEQERQMALRCPERGPMKMYVGSLHFNITEEMLRGIFEPFGKIQSLQLIVDHDTGTSKGYGFLTFAEAEDAKKALEQMNGFELAGKAIRMGHVTDKTSESALQQMGSLDTDDQQNNRVGMELGTTGRLALMAKLAEGTGMKLPEMATQALNQNAMMSGAGHFGSVASINASAYHQQQHHQQQQLAAMNPSIATQCFLLSNMFDPSNESQPQWDSEIRDDVIEECNKHGGIVHIYVDTNADQGNVYVKCPTITTAVASVNSLHGRWFAGKVITAAYIPVLNYHNLFPDSMNAMASLQTRR